MRIDVDVRFPTETEMGEHDSEEDAARIADLYQSLDDADLQPLWTQAARLVPQIPRPRAVPWLWGGKALLHLAERAGELITVRRGGDRRVLALANPGLGGMPFATPTLWGAIQYLNPRESAPGHRHTPGAIRFVTEGEGTWTTVDGDACDMGEGDLVLTPPWTWHDHTNGSDRRMTWFDGLDLPLVLVLDATFFEPYTEEELQPVRGRNISTRLYRGRGSVPLLDPYRQAPGRQAPVHPHSPLLVYRREDTDASLAALLEERGGPMVSMEFVNPLTGGPVMATLGCEMHRLVPGGRTSARRRVGSSIFVAYRGSGSSVIDGQCFEWEAGDLFAVPSWALVDHGAHEPSDLFSVTDAPVLRALGLDREERLPDHQAVVSTFRPR